MAFYPDVDSIQLLKGCECSYWRDGHRKHWSRM